MTRSLAPTAKPGRLRRIGALAAIALAAGVVDVATLPVAPVEAAPVYWNAAPGTDRISVIGDSVMAGIRWYGTWQPLRSYSYVADLESCRRTTVSSCGGREGYQPDTTLNAMRRLSGQLGSVLVVGTGYNDPGATFGSSIDAVMAEAARQGIPVVIWATMRTADVTYVSPTYASNASTFRDNNRILLGKAAQYGGRLQVADWATYSASRRDWVTGDGIHLTPSGAMAMAEFIADRAAIALGRVSLPSAPTLYHEVIGANAVRLAWTAPASAGGTPIVGYGYDISPNGGATWISGGAGPEGSRSVVVGGLLENGVYLVRLIARNSEGWGAYSNTILVNPRRLLPSAATLYHEVIGANAVRLAWTAPASAGGTPIINYGYEISPNGGATWISGGAGPEGSRSVVVGGLLEGGVYLVRLTAQNSEGWGAYSNTILVNPRRLLPSAPTLYHEVIGANAVRLAWTAPASAGGTPIINYGYEISPNGGATWISGGAGPEGSRSVVVGGLLEGGVYLVRLTAQNSDGWGAYSNTILVNPRRLLPSAPTLYHEVIGANAVRLAWTAPASAGGTPIINYGYEISPNGGATWISGGAGPEGSRSVVVGGLLENGVYLVRLTARNSDGWGAYSNTILVKPGGSYLLAAVSTEDTVVVDAASSEPVYSEPAPTESPGGVATVVTEASETEVAADAAVALDAASSEPVDSEPEPTESPGGVATLVPEASEPDVAVGDLVFIDANRDGVQDVEDLGLGGVEVRLVDDSGTVVDRDVSDSAGRYQLESLASGSHLLEVVVPTGYQPTLVDVGPDDAVDSDPEPADVQIGPLETTVRIDLDAADVARLDVDFDIGLVTVPEDQPAASTTTTTTTTTVAPPTTTAPPTTLPPTPPTTVAPPTTTAPPTTLPPTPPTTATPTSADPPTTAAPPPTADPPSEAPTTTESTATASTPPG